MTEFLACHPFYACTGWFIIGIAVGMGVVVIVEELVLRNYTPK